MSIAVKYTDALSAVDTADTMAVHFGDNTEITDNKEKDSEEITTSEIAVPEILDTKTEVKKKAIQEISFEAEKFSVYGVIGTEVIEKTVLASDGHNYKITVTYGPEAEIPAGSKLKVEEILPGTELYDSYNEQAIYELSPKEGSKGYSSPISDDEDSYEAHIVSLPEETEVGFARYFDISIVHNGSEIEPKAAVEVKIEYAEPIELSAGEELQIVHFAEDGIEIISPEINGKEIVFEQESFSVTATVTTTISNNSGYALLVQYDGKYYELLFDGTLEEVTPSGTNSYTVGSADRWTYTRIGWGNNYSIRVQTNTGYEYIDPASSDGISTTQRTITRTASGNGYYISGGGAYLGVTTDAEGNPVDYSLRTLEKSSLSQVLTLYWITFENSPDGINVQINKN